MKLRFLGGIDEVGASCLLLELETASSDLPLRLLVDGGIRLRAREGDYLPLLEQIGPAGGLDAVIVTHSHIDHIGSLPIIYQSYPSLPLYTTLASSSIMPIQWQDSLKLMQLRAQEEEIPPFYDQQDVQQALQAIRPVPFTQTLSLFQDRLQLTFYPAGHILGAASVFLQTDRESIWISGDLSVDGQRTIPGMVVPPIEPEVIVLESTYGSFTHPPRQIEESRLVEQAAEVTAAGGAILYPVFAIGRSQEVILILSQAIEQGRMEPVPIFVDGMVLSICEVYQRHLELLQPALRRRIEKQGPVLSRYKKIVRPVRSAKQRQEYSQLRPAIFVATAGMLGGGPSVFYAQQLLNEPKNLMAITGYQDEESPGRQLQRVAAGEREPIKVGGRSIQPKCQIQSYGLSAHADRQQLLDLLGELQAGARNCRVILGHGETQARADLSQLLQENGIRQVDLPLLGDSLQIAPSENQPARLTASDSSPQEEPHPLLIREGKILSQDLPLLANHLLQQDGAGHYYSIQDLILSAGNAEGAIAKDEIERVSRMLRYKHSPFKGHAKSGVLFRVKTTPAETDPTAGMDLNTALTVVDQLISADSGLYRRGGDVQHQSLRLYFAFPDALKSSTVELIEQIQEETGWKVQIHPQPHQQLMMETLIRLLPDGCSWSKNPSIHLEQRRVELQLSSARKLEAAEVEALDAQFLAQTGYQLQLCNRETVATAAGSMEINQAFQTIRDYFQQQPHQPLKIGQKGPTLELSFITAEIGRRYQSQLSRLEESIGWPIQLRSSPNQDQLLKTARQLIPATWELKGQPGVLQAEKSVRVRVSNSGSEAGRREIEQAFEQKTGYTLQFSIPSA